MKGKTLKSCKMRGGGLARKGMGAALKNGGKPKKMAFGGATMARKPISAPSMERKPIGGGMMERMPRVRPGMGRGMERKPVSNMERMPVARPGMTRPAFKHGGKVKGKK